VWFVLGKRIDKCVELVGSLCAGTIAPRLLFSGERTRLARCRRRLADDFLLVGQEKHSGEAPKWAREGARAPRI